MSTTTRRPPRQRPQPRAAQDPRVQRPPMDARIRQRRIDVRRASARRRRRVVGGLLLTALAVAGAIGITRSPLFAITGVRVDGVDAARVAEVKEAANVARGQNLMSADLDDALLRTEALPWVQDATVARKPPSTVVVTVVPRKPIAILAGAQGMWLVDRAGVVIAEAAGEQLPRIDLISDTAPVPGAPIDDAAADNALALYEALPRDVRRSLLEVEASGPRTVLIRLALDQLDDPGGYKPGRTAWVRMGAAGGVREQIVVLRALLGQLRLAGDPVPSEVDVRVPSNPVVIP